CPFAVHESLEYYKNYYFPMSFGQHADYHCIHGYTTPSGEYWVRMVCSERGWYPEPKCLKQCHVRQLENGYFSYGRKNVYKEGERVKYVCSDDYYAEHKDGQVTCTKDDWSPPPRCIRKSKCARILLRFLAKTDKSSFYPLTCGMVCMTMSDGVSRYLSFAGL
uniref:Sushi domain-containing protein n=1 Tax=Buteo japonicus TaxID=224669 RepID=A0A8B9Z170_9AVES